MEAPLRDLLGDTQHRPQRAKSAASPDLHWSALLSVLLVATFYVATVSACKGIPDEQ
jgi:hypothetical protein